MWLFLWLLVGGTSGYLANKLERRYGPAQDKRTRAKERIIAMTVGIAAGPIATAMLPYCAYDAARRRKLVEGPSGHESIPQCLRLRAAIQYNIAEIDKEMEKRQALLGGVLTLLENDFNRQASEQAGIRPDSGEMPDPAKTEQACQEWLDLKRKREELEQGLARTEERIADLRASYEGQLEATGIPRTLLQPNRRLMRPYESVPSEEEDTLLSLPPFVAPEPLAPTPEEREAELLAKLGQPRLKQMERLLLKAASPMNFINGWPVCNLAGLIDGPPLEMPTAKYQKKARSWIAEWVLSHYGDSRLAIAITETKTPKEMAELVRFRLEQASRTVYLSPQDEDGSNAAESLQRHLDERQDDDPD